MLTNILKYPSGRPLHTSIFEYTKFDENISDFA